MPALQNSRELDLLDVQPAAAALGKQITISFKDAV